jgi:FkbM family methyltransferase
VLNSDRLRRILLKLAEWTVASALAALSARILYDHVSADVAHTVADQRSWLLVWLIYFSGAVVAGAAYASNHFQRGAQVPVLRQADSLLRIASVLSRHLPRGKGAVIRGFGKIFLPPNRYFMTTRHGAKLVLSPDSLDVYATMAQRQNAWDYHDFEVCFSSAPDGSVFYDVGANVGYFSVEMEVRTAGAVRAVAFEPNESLAAAIEDSARLNSHSRLMVISALVGDRNCEAPMFVARASIHSSAVADSNRRCKRIVRKRMVSIDALVQAGSIPPPDTIKMDIEGSEHLALRGAACTMRTYKPHLFMEYHLRDDPGRRIWAEIKRLLCDCSEYELYCSPQLDLRRNFPVRFFRYSTPDDLEITDNLFLHNPTRPLRSTSMLGPPRNKSLMRG